MSSGYDYEEYYCNDEKIIEGFSFQIGILGNPDRIVIRENKWSDPVGGKFRAPVKDIESYVKFINEKQLEEAIVWVQDLSFLLRCPTLKRLDIAPPIGYEGDMDYSPLYQLPRIQALQCAAYNEEWDEYFSEIDYSKINGLECLMVQVSKGMKNFEKIPTLKSLFISNFKGRNRDLTDMFCSEQLDVLVMISCGIKSLRGLDQSKKMERMSFSYCRSLEDISELVKAKDTLKSLEIDTCGKIKDFSVLEDLENLEELKLIGNNTIPNLNFLKKMKNLRVFIFSMNVADGDLNPCMDIPTVSCVRYRRHYNIKEKELPHAIIRKRPTAIEPWRRNFLFVEH